MSGAGLDVGIAARQAESRPYLRESLATHAESRSDCDASPST